MGRFQDSGSALPIADSNSKTGWVQTDCVGLGPEGPVKEFTLTPAITKPESSALNMHGGGGSFSLAVHGNCRPPLAGLHASLVADFQIRFSSLVRATYPLTLSSLGFVVFLLSGTAWQMVCDFR